MGGLECSEIHFSSLERTHRIDSEFYKKGNLQIFASLQKKNLQPFTESFLVSDGNHMSISDSFRQEGIPYYRGQDIHNVFIEQASPICIDSKAFNHPHMQRSHLKRNDVLVSIVGTIGKSAMVSADAKAACSCKLAIMRNRKADINSETLLTFIKTEYGQSQIQKFRRGSVQTGLLLEDFDQLLIPVFTSDFQELVSHIVWKAHETMQYGNERYAQARIELLHALRFNPLSISSDNMTVKDFSKSFSVSGRLDAEYYQPKYDDLFSLLRGFPTKTLGEIVEISKSIEPGREYYGDEGIPFIRVSDVSVAGIDAPSVRIPKRTVPSIEKLYPKEDTILFSKDGSVGIAYKMEQDMEAVTSGALLHLRVRNAEEVSPDYLTLVLNSEIVRLQAERDASGAIIQHWKPSDIENVVIPVLPRDVQREISAKARESFALRREAERLIEAAVKAVETAIERDEAAAMERLNAETS